MLATSINVTHSIDGVRVARRPRAAVRNGRPVVIIDMVGAAPRIFPAHSDVAVTGYTEPFPAGAVKAMRGACRIDYAEREGGFSVSRKPR